ncbi:MAG: universal stress protein [Pseudomonadota bacterium]
MTAIKHILVATDGSSGALRAAALAGDLAQAISARVSLIYVQSDELVMPHMWGPGEFPASDTYASLNVDQVRELLDQNVMAKEIPESLAALGECSEKPQVTLVWGHPADEICNYANKHDVDLIVIGSHGRSGLKEMLLGSVSHAVANRGPCPVTVVR